ncbi:transmembrane amino acid transporter [Xylariaceae sp. FL0804]|nr:transmembrane amino acid transporter [Xylariaceae sp. FL0804]
MSVIPTGPMGLTTATAEMDELHNPENLGRMSVSKEHRGIRQRLYGLQARMAPGISFEEYTFWAKIEREMEEEEHRQYLAATAGQGFIGGVKAYFSSGSGVPKIAGTPVDASGERPHIPPKEKHGISVADDSTHSDELTPVAPTHDYDADWRQAARALRTAGWMTIFYLITTDILGWSQTPYVFASAGYGLGVGIFVLFGIAAGFSGLMIWKVFMGLDSSRYPVLSFGDPFFRLFGPKTCKFINVMQAFQMFCSVAVVLIGQSQVLSQLAHAKVCYIAIVVINMVVGMASGWLRAIKHLGWLCNCAVWINIISFIIICVAAAEHGPDPLVANQTTLIKGDGPVMTFVNTPPAEYQQQTTNMFAAQFNGIDTIVYAYSGAVLFVAFMSEMRRPMDFWKGMLLAQSFIGVVYVFFGAFVYTYIGQYSITSISQVVSPYSLQLVSNILALITGYLAIFLYFNIGLKTVYLEVGQQVLGFPPITERKGYLLWLGLGPVYWVLALVLAVSVPNFTSITNLIGALFGLNFTYSIPAIMFAAYIIQEYSRLPGEGFDAHTGITTRHDEGVSRWVRGLKKSWKFSVPAIIFALGGLAASGMGCWSAIESLISIFGPGGTIQTSWGCTAIG